MLNQRRFEQRHTAQWQALRGTLIAMRSPTPTSKATEKQIEEFPDLYLSVCNHLSIARTRGYSPELVETLNQLVLDSYNQMYKFRGSRFATALRFLTTGFPRLVRKHSKLFWISAALFYLPALLVGYLCYLDNEFILRIVDPGMVADMEYMYEPGSVADFRSEDRSSASDFEMFGYYINNNIGISFRVFAGGILFGIGTIFFMVYNGIVIGAVAGHLTGIGYIETFWGFVSGHGPFELTAICLSGMSGLLIAIALIKPGNLSRADSLKKQSLIAVQLVLGAAFMMLMAAFVEAYWSSTQLDPSIKYIVGLGFWFVTISYLVLAGRGGGYRES